ncbi:MAG: NAD+ synthase [Spirochaetaceae bacterium]|jgi:NAD+ synthase (glutamine-hydrolysing)|nr:NAD+ synthase [Spirochaetaceae bacterium]
MRIAIAQINSTVGDFDGNVQKIIDITRRALEEHDAHLILFPELAICGYPPMDLLDQDFFVENNERALHSLQHGLPPDIACAVGYVSRNTMAAGKSLVNAYGILYGGTLVFQQTKTLLPTYDVFDEARNFESAKSWNLFDWMGERIGFAICEDVWRETETPGTKYAEDPVRRLMDAGITFLCVPSASPFYANKHSMRLKLASRIAHRGNLLVAYINAVGANDSIIFDGRSFFLLENNVISANSFEEDLLLIDFNHGELYSIAGRDVKTVELSSASPEQSLQTGGVLLQTGRSVSEASVQNAPLSLTDTKEIEDALVMGIREYMNKCGFKKAHLGLSGGIDSALVAYLAVKAIGAENVTAISMPSRFSSQGSKDDAAALAKNLGCGYEVIAIEPLFTAFLDALAGVFKGQEFDTAEENLQARIRGSLLMAFSNKWNSMLLATGNKSELAMGYCTLYGDMNGALCPIGDLFKTEVFALCRDINKRENKKIIPQAIIDKPPSAELRPNQKDEDSLPPYDLLDKLLCLYLFENLSAPEIAARGFDKTLAADIVKQVARSEFKRRQAPPVLKVSARAFGMGRRMPIARKIYECVFPF